MNQIPGSISERRLKYASGDTQRGKTIFGRYLKNYDLVVVPTFGGS